MPDVTMCDSETCYLRTKCYRNPASGTKPSEFQQSWFTANKEGDACGFYWAKEERNG